jgi:hypothetical protein
VGTRSFQGPQNLIEALFFIHHDATVGQLGQCNGYPRRRRKLLRSVESIQDFRGSCNTLRRRLMRMPRPPQGTGLTFAFLVCCQLNFDVNHVLAASEKTRVS